MNEYVRCGADRLVENPELYLPAGNIALVTNHTGQTRDGKPLAQALIERGVKLTTLFSPEHGLGGQAGAGEKVGNSVDPATQLPVYSLYGAARRPSPEQLAEVVAVVYDIQTIGVRFYTYISTMFEVLQACADTRKPFILLDRPDPITGAFVEGTVLEYGFRSFVGCAEYATRPGMTIGELAEFFNAHYSLKAQLSVIRVEGWRRDMWYDQTGLPWVPPSPNIPDLETALVYVGTCAFEGTNLSEGRGTSSPFLTIGAPWIQGDEFAAHMNDVIRQKNLQGVSCTAAQFTPTSSKHAGTACEGLTTRVTDRNTFEPFTWGLYLVSEVRRLYPDHFGWLARTDGSGTYFFDLLMGTDRVRMMIDQGTSVEEILRREQPRLDEFKRERRTYLMYE